MDTLTHNFLLIVSCCSVVCFSGRAQAIPSCDIELKVQRGTKWKVAPQERLTVRCPVKHCGQPLNITWCKWLDDCEQINNTEDVEIGQRWVNDELISLLTFKKISTNDSGLYRCYFKGYNYEAISNAINISVSDLNKEVEYSNDNEDEFPSVAADEDEALWLPYFLICLGTALLVATLTLLTLLMFKGQKRMTTYNDRRRKETSTHTIPDLPKQCASSTLFLQTHPSVLNDFYSQRTAENPQLPLTTNGNHPSEANTSNGSEASGRAVYAFIRHQQTETPAREPNTATAQDKKAEYSAINVSGAFVRHADENMHACHGTGSC